MSRDVVIHFLSAMARTNASDLYLTVGAKPLMRVQQDMVPVSDDELTPVTLHSIVHAVLDEGQRAEFADKLEYNTALDLGETGRFRVNIMQQKQCPALVIRRIVSEIPSIEALKLPEIYRDLVMERRGLVLLAGMTGSGKSTSMASMIDYRNRRESGHIITIEDPVEYYHAHQKSIVTQREIGVDTHSYADALKNALRQRPDVILIGEIRDREVMEQAISCAETGHLCLATVHANNAYQAIERCVNFFPEEQAPQVRMSLSSNLKGVLSQRLLPSEKGGMVPVLEILLNQGLVRELVSKGEVGRISEVMEKNSILGMRTFDQSLMELYKAGELSEQAVITQADKPEEMKVKLKSLGGLSHQSPTAEDQNFMDMSDRGDPNASDKDTPFLGTIDTSSLRLKDE